MGGFVFSPLTRIIMGKVYFLTRRGTIVLLRWLMVIVLGYLLIFSPADKSHLFAKAGIILLLILSNLALSLISYERFVRWRLEYGILIMDILLVSGGIYLTGDLDLYLIYFLSILMASLSRDVKGSLIIATIAGGIYAVLFFKTKAPRDILSPTLLIRLPLLYIIALFSSFLAQEAAQEKGRHQKTQLLLHLAERMNATADQEKIFEMLQEFWPHFKKLDGAAVYLFPPKDKPLLLKRHWTRKAKGISPVTALPYDNIFPALREKMQNRQPYYLPGGNPLLNQQFQLPGAVRSLYFAPLILKAAPQGILLLGSHALDAFNAEDREVFRFLGEQLAFSLENARLFFELGQNAVELSSLINVGRILSSSLEPRQVLEDAVEQTKRVMRVEACSLLLLDEVRQVLTFEVALGGKDQEIKKVELALGEGVAGWVAQKGEPLIVNNPAADPRFAAKVDQKTKFTTRSLMAVPLKIKGRTLGVLEAINHLHEEGFAARDLALFEALANQITVALENAQLYSHLSREKTRMEAILAGMVEGVVVIDAQGKVILTNQSAQKILGVPADDWGKEAAPLSIPAMQLLQLLTHTYQTKATLSEALAIKSQEKKIYQVHTVPISGIKGEAAGALAVLEDITELSRLSELKTEFVSHVSHELRTPLTSVKGAANLLLRQQVGTLNEKQRKLISIVREDCDTLVSLINDLLDLSRLESGIIQVKKTEENIAQIAYRCIEAQRPLAEEKNIALSLQSAPDLPTIKVDKDLIRQVFQNLIGNALKFTPPQGKITVEVKAVYPLEEQAASGGMINHIEVTVADTGMGLKPGDLSKIFEKFYQVNRGQDVQTKGTGLGLSICKQIIESHGGRLWAESDGPGQGSRFYFVLAPE